MKPVFKYVLAGSTFNGALPSLFGATAAVVERQPEFYKGSYVDGKGKTKEVSKDARDLKLAASLWATTEKMVGDFFAKSESL